MAWFQWALSHATVEVEDGTGHQEKQPVKWAHQQNGVNKIGQMCIHINAVNSHVSRYVTYHMVSAFLKISFIQLLTHSANSY